MPQFSWTTGPRYCRVTFDAQELDVIRTACAAVAAREQERLDEAAGEGLEQYASQARRESEALMAGKLASLLKPGYEILIGVEDLEPVRQCLEAYSGGLAGKQAETLASALRKIEEAIGGSSPPLL